MRTPSRPVTQSLCILVGSLPFLESATADTKAAPESEHYVRGKASRDGIGKFYMGREISQWSWDIWGHPVERPQKGKGRTYRSSDQKHGLETSRPGGDIGAGSGYFTFRMATLVPQGKVYAVDIFPRCLRIVRSRIRQNQISNAGSPCKAPSKTRCSRKNPLTWF